MRCYLFRASLRLSFIYAASLSDKDEEGSRNLEFELYQLRAQHNNIHPSFERSDAEWEQLTESVMEMKEAKDNLEKTVDNMKATLMTQEKNAGASRQTI